MNRAELALEARQRRGVDVHQALERDSIAARAVARVVHRAIAALAERAQDLIPSEQRLIGGEDHEFRGGASAEPRKASQMASTWE